MQFIVLANKKGGVCKTTTLYGLAYILGKVFGKKVLAIDTDDQGDLTLAAGLELESFNHGMHTLITEKSSLDQCIYKTTIDNVDIIPCDERFEDCIEGLYKNNDRTTLKNALCGLSGYDYVLVDTAPGGKVVLENVLRISDTLKVIVPVTTEYFSLSGLNNFFGRIGKINADLLNNRTKVLISKINEARKTDNANFMKKIQPLIDAGMVFEDYVKRDQDLMKSLYNETEIRGGSKFYFDLKGVAGEILSWLN